MNIFITGSNGFVGSHLKEYINTKYSNYKLFLPSSKELDLSDELAVDDYILGAMMLYVDIIKIFIRILKILEKMNDKKKK
jgi:FtsH-binding integral membrane protein